MLQGELFVLWIYRSGHQSLQGQFPRFGKSLEPDLDWTIGLRGPTKDCGWTLSQQYRKVSCALAHVFPNPHLLNETKGVTCIHLKFLKAGLCRKVRSPPQLSWNLEWEHRRIAGHSPRTTPRRWATQSSSMDEAPGNTKRDWAPTSTDFTSRVNDLSCEFVLSLPYFSLSKMASLFLLHFSYFAMLTKISYQVCSNA